ncbi:MAG: hypothetical protein MZW92_81910 [Comamonadaceae bacterium]|nr:hypothetical protein [Comamonadaceae bacterium]
MRKRLRRACRQAAERAARAGVVVMGVSGCGKTAVGQPARAAAGLRPSSTPTTCTRRPTSRRCAPASRSTDADRAPLAGSG